MNVSVGALRRHVSYGALGRGALGLGLHQEGQDRGEVVVAEGGGFPPVLHELLVGVLLGARPLLAEGGRVVLDVVDRRVLRVVTVEEHQDDQLAVAQLVDHGRVGVAVHDHHVRRDRRLRHRGDRGRQLGDGLLLRQACGALGDHARRDARLVPLRAVVEAAELLLVLLVRHVPLGLGGLLGGGQGLGLRVQHGVAPLDGKWLLRFSWFGYIRLNIAKSRETTV